MSYEKLNLKNGTKLTAEHMTHIEEGIAKNSANNDALSVRVDSFTTLPDGSTIGDAELIDGRIDYTGHIWGNVGGHIRGVTGRLSEEIAKRDECMGIVPSPNLLDLSSVETGILLQNGTIASSYSDFQTTGFIPIHEGETLRFQFTFNGNRYDNTAVPNYTSMSRVVAYDADKNSMGDVAGGFGMSVPLYTALTGTAFVRVSFKGLNEDPFTDSALIVSDDPMPLPFIAYGEYQSARLNNLDEKVAKLEGGKTANKTFCSYKGAYDSEITFPDLTTSAKSMVLNSLLNVSSFTDVTMGIKNSDGVLFYVKVDASKVYIYDIKYGTGGTAEYAHGLTIEGNVGISVVMDSRMGATISIISAGVTYAVSYPQSIIRAYIGYPYLSLSGSSDWVSFSASIADIDKDIWIFGDSYLGDSPERWAYYLNRNGVNNYMLDGYGGEGSIQAYTSFQSLTALKTPKYVVWCLGMNDSTLFDRWRTYFDNVRAYCDANGIMFVGATIPSVPTINHEDKNAYVRSCGCNYIDFARAVGAGASGNWFTGMLSADGVHPSETGAKTLYHCAITDFPQLLAN